MIYVRQNRHTFFVWPALAFGYDPVEQLPWMEVAWLIWAVGVGRAS